MSATATYFFSITASAGPKNYASAVQDLVGHIKELPLIVKLRERGRLRKSLNGHLQIIDCQLSISISLMLYTKFGCHPQPTTTTTVLLLISRIKPSMDQVRQVEVRGGVQGQYRSPQVHCRSLQVTVGHPRVTRGNHRLNIGLFRLTPGHLIGYWSTQGW